MDNDGLVNMLKKNGVLTCSELEDAMRKIDRALFCPVRPYEDDAQPIGHGATISQPSTIVMMTQALSPKKGDNVLEIGSGSGYQSALLWAMGCKVTSVEKEKAVHEIAKKNLDKVGAKVKLVVGDGSAGYQKNAPYDRIIVTAAAPSVPGPLLDQLKTGGRMVIPVGKMVQQVKVVEKKEKGTESKSLGFFMFVPLLGEHGF